MNNKKRLLLSLLLSLTALVSCGETIGDVSSNVIDQNSSETSISDAEPEFIDYAANFKYDTTSNRVSEIVTVKNYVDGDTVHFNSKNGKNGVLKARFLGIDTPESTGKVQNWGKTASNFTKNALLNSAEIMIESDTNKWDLDSTGERHLVWVWYRPSVGADWKLLNLEITQEGLAQGKNASSTSYGEVMTAALNQAIMFKKCYYSGEIEPGFYTGEAIPVTLREIRENITDYVSKTVQFEALVTRISGQTAYVEHYDGETDRMYGIPVYMGFNFTCEFVKPGNLISWIGNIEYYETGGTYQLSNLTYIATKPDYKKNVKLVSTDNEINPTPITYEDINNYGESLQGVNVSMSNLKVNKIYTTNNGGDNDGAMTLTCTDSSNNTVKVRTAVLYDDNKNMIVENDLLNKTISIKSGTVEYYEGNYQIKVFVYSDIIL